MLNKIEGLRRNLKRLISKKSSGNEGPDEMSTEFEDKPAAN
jgi:hypothetical protein